MEHHQWHRIESHQYLIDLVVLWVIDLTNKFPIGLIENWDVPIPEWHSNKFMFTINIDIHHRGAVRVIEFLDNFQIPIEEFPKGDLAIWGGGYNKPIFDIAFDLSDDWIVGSDIFLYEHALVFVGVNYQVSIINIICSD